MSEIPYQPSLLYRKNITHFFLFVLFFYFQSNVFFSFFLFCQNIYYRLTHMGPSENITFGLDLESLDSYLIYNIRHDGIGERIKKNFFFIPFLQLNKYSHLWGKWLLKFSAPSTKCSGWSLLQLCSRYSYICSMNNTQSKNAWRGGHWIEYSLQWLYIYYPLLMDHLDLLVVVDQ